MMCHRIGMPPISTIGLGRAIVSSDNLVPNPPARMTVFIALFPAAPHTGSLAVVGACLERPERRRKNSAARRSRSGSCTLHEFPSVGASLASLRQKSANYAQDGAGLSQTAKRPANGRLGLGETARGRSGPWCRSRQGGSTRIDSYLHFGENIRRRP